MPCFLARCCWGFCLWRATPHACCLLPLQRHMALVQRSVRPWTWKEPRNGLRASLPRRNASFWSGTRVQRFQCRGKSLSRTGVTSATRQATMSTCLSTEDHLSFGGTTSRNSNMTSMRFDMPIDTDRRQRLRSACHAQDRPTGRSWVCPVDGLCRPGTACEALYKRSLGDRRSEMRHTGGMKRETTIPDSQRLGRMLWAGANVVFAQPR